MLVLRPHHIVDIVAGIGNGAKLEPHPYGHLVHVVARTITDDVDQMCRLVVACDDICGPCVHLKDGKCDDVLRQLDHRPSKQEYNDGLDRRVLDLFGIRPNQELRVRDYLGLVRARVDEVAALCTHPREDGQVKRDGLGKGLDALGV